MIRSGNNGATSLDVKVGLEVLFHLCNEVISESWVFSIPFWCWAGVGSFLVIAPRSICETKWIRCWVPAAATCLAGILSASAVNFFSGGNIALTSWRWWSWSWSRSGIEAPWSIIWLRLFLSDSEEQWILSFNRNPAATFLFTFALINT